MEWGWVVVTEKKGGCYQKKESIRVVRQTKTQSRFKTGVHFSVPERNGCVTLLAKEGKKVDCEGGEGHLVRRRKEHRKWSRPKTGFVSGRGRKQKKSTKNPARGAAGWTNRQHGQQWRNLTQKQGHDTGSGQHFKATET